MKLYYAPLSTYCMKALMALHEKGVAFDPRFVNPMDAEAWGKYCRLWPIGKIPLLELDNGQLFPEATVIAEYADRLSANGPRLVPEDPDAALEVRLQDRLMDHYLNDQVVALLFENRKPEAERDPVLLERSANRLDAMYQVMAGNLERRRWVAGDDFSLADCAAAAGLFYAPRVHPFDGHSAIVEYWERLSARPSFQRVAEEARPMVERFLAGPGAANSG
jgi:glutathione S-transferase